MASKQAKDHQLDQIDLQILKELQKNARMQRNHLAEIVNLSVPSVSERMRKLEEKELIEGYYAVLNEELFGFDITAYIFVEVENSNKYPDFVRHVLKLPEVLECHSITGDGSHIVKVRTKSTTTFERLLTKIQSWDGVYKTRSNIVLSSFKETREIPLDLDGNHI
jgi:Lrp/AsnC family leucine-responsive transcriptional regulator